MCEVTDMKHLKCNVGDTILFGDREAILIKPITPAGMDKGQLWEMKFKSLPCPVFRWVNNQTTKVLIKATVDGGQF